LPALALWIALFVGLSPTLLDLARHWTAETWAAPFALFVPLWFIAVRQSGAGSRPRSFGLLLIVAGLLLATFAATSGVTRWGRYGVPIAVVGLAMWLGTPSAARAVVAAWWIPLPHFLQTALFLPLSRIGERLASDWQSWTGGAPVYTAKQLLPAIDAVPIGPADLGLQVCWFLAGVAWYAGVTGGRDLRGSAGLVLRAALLGVAIQMLALALAVPLTIAGSAALARGFLDLVVPLVAFGALLWLVLGHRQRVAAPLGAGVRS
jgi:hypothetical protein